MVRVIRTITFLVGIILGILALAFGLIILTNTFPNWIAIPGFIFFPLTILIAPIIGLIHGQEHYGINLWHSVFFSYGGIVITYILSLIYKAAKRNEYK